MKSVRFWVIAAGALLFAALLLCANFAPAGAQVLPTRFISIDEDGHGFIGYPDAPTQPPTPLPFALLHDPGPGGLDNVLTYDLLNPPNLVAGDILMQEGVGGPVYDVLRFNPLVPGTPYLASVCFYSDNIDGFDALADTPGPPAAYYTNSLTIVEEVFDGWEGAYYTPLENQPGFVPGFSVQYRFVSDAVPEPTTSGLLAMGLGLLALGALRRR